MKRRDLLRTAAGAGAAAGAATATAGTAAAQTTMPDFGSHLSNVDGGTEDLRGNSEVTVEVGASGNGGNLAFSPAGIWIDPGTTVIWEWTGEGGGHNVETVDGPASLGSETVSESGFTYEFEFTEDHAGITNYQCGPHASLGMKGAVAVGGDVPTVEVGGGGGAAWPVSLEDFAHDVGVPIQKHYVGIASFLGIAVSLVFTFYVLKYGESPNTGRGGA
ncbi:halocyanin domain-containing protein [Halonotius terrestris]|uniref:Halocyanin domain-containing protein n=1 Tax=Halonotius terrestris TaxID=2487750 RepID=A0A8J8PDL3_9EURY|nr:halocyanin domain-containing protein [Halonotius terrestris]TQQ83360.1 halocyanin domain-containing protein [Halonotius terrestris]